MARDISTGFKTEIEADALCPIRLIKAEFDSGTVFLWSGIGVISYNGDTYLGAGHLLEISEIKEEQDLRSNGTSFKLSGVDSSLTAIALNEKVRGREISVYESVLDDIGQIVGEPYLSFSGAMDSMSMSENGAESSISIMAENDLSDLTIVRERRYTPEDQKAVYPDDRGLDFVPKIQDIELTWGVGL